MKAEPPGPPPPYLNYILGITAYAAGTVDIISFAKLGGTLASAMTGNLAFLGLYLACFFLYFAGALSAGLLVYLNMPALIALPFAAALLALCFRR